MGNKIDAQIDALERHAKLQEDMVKWLEFQKPEIKECMEKAFPGPFTDREKKIFNEAFRLSFKSCMAYFVAQDEVLAELHYPKTKTH